MYYINDHLNSPAALLDGSNGAVAQRYEYDAYGVRHVFNADYTVDMTDQQTEVCTLTNVGFTGQRLEVLDTGGLQLAYYKNRWYDPELGRFMSQDPVGLLLKPNLALHYQDGLNLYQYVNSNPISDVDIYGLYPYKPEILPPYDPDGYDPREDDDPYGHKVRPATPPCPADVCGKTQQEIDSNYKKCLKSASRTTKFVGGVVGILCKGTGPWGVLLCSTGTMTILEDEAIAGCDAMKGWCDGGNNSQPYPPASLFWP